MSKTWTEKILKDGDIVPFVAHTHDYGLAEFAFCAQWKRGKITKLFIYPMQQGDVEYYYLIESGFSDGLSVSSWTHKGMKEPWIWRHLWCKDHKCQTFHAYVPPDSIQFRVQVLSSLCITFENGK